MAIVNNRKQVGIFGGTFDPVHIGHLELALQAKDKFHLDQVIFIPASISPLKQEKPITASVHRVTMLELALKNYPESSISMQEVFRKGVPAADHRSITGR